MEQTRQVGLISRTGEGRFERTGNLGLFGPTTLPQHLQVGDIRLLVERLPRVNGSVPCVFEHRNQSIDGLPVGKACSTEPGVCSRFVWLPGCETIAHQPAPRRPNAEALPPMLESSRSGCHRMSPRKDERPPPRAAPATAKRSSRAYRGGDKGQPSRALTGFQLWHRPQDATEVDVAPPRERRAALRTP